jgi:ABC-type polysaccharide/polyol phosphate transport system ATPase subunit
METAEVKEIPNTRSISDEEAINVANATILYRSYKEQPNTLKETILNFVKHGKVKYYSTFPALNNISFTVKKGEIVGFIGSNGAGKSTLLNMLAGVLPPNQGSVNVKGSIDSLRSLGAGFDSELNAIENIYLYGSLRGQSRNAIKARVPEILKFAELEEFKQTPVKYYSSGMFARLGFACAIDKNPDVLLVDEVLAVGDERFQAKCNEVFKTFLKEGRTVVIVSHNMSALEKLCTRIGLLSKGRLMFLGDPKEAIAKYRSGEYEIALDGKRL